MSAINSKNDELDENLKKFDKLNQSLMEYETKIKYYMVKAQIFSNDNFKIDGDMEENKKMVERFDDEIKDFTTKKESLNKKISQLEEEIKANKKRKEELTSESEKLDKEIESRVRQYQKRKNQTRIS